MNDEYIPIDPVFDLNDTDLQQGLAILMQFATRKHDSPMQEKIAYYVNGETKVQHPFRDGDCLLVGGFGEAEAAGAFLFEIAYHADCIMEMDLYTYDAMVYPSFTAMDGDENEAYLMGPFLNGDELDDIVLGYVRLAFGFMSSIWSVPITVSALTYEQHQKVRDIRMTP